MLNLIVLTSILLFISFSFCLVCLLSNEWYFIGRRVDCSKWNCVFSTYSNDYFEEKLRFGLWYACPFVKNGPGLTWVSAYSLKSACLEFRPHIADHDRSKVPNIFAKHLNNQNLIDIEPYQLAQVKVLAIIGSVALFLATIWTFSILVYLCQNPTRRFLSSGVHTLALFILVVTDFSTRLVALILFAINADNYLDYIFRTSYTLQTSVNYFTSEYDEAIREYLSNYRLTFQWSFWLFVFSVFLSFLCLTSIVWYFLVIRLGIFYDIFYKSLNRTNQRCETTKYSSKTLPSRYRCRAYPDDDTVVNIYHTKKDPYLNSGRKYAQNNDLFVLDDYLTFPKKTNQKYVTYCPNNHTDLGFKRSNFSHAGYLNGERETQLDIGTIRGASYYYDDYFQPPPERLYRATKTSHEYPYSSTTKYIGNYPEFRTSRIGATSNIYESNDTNNKDNNKEEIENKKIERKQSIKKRLSFLNRKLKSLSFSNFDPKFDISDFKKIIIREKIKTIEKDGL
jgi:hypothetical protein